MTHAAIWIDPARMGGKPCLHGHRLPVSHVALNIDAEGSVDAYMESYGIDPSERRNVLCAAAWWVLNSSRRYKHHRELRKRWRDWAEVTWHNAWNTVEPVELDDPPARTEGGAK